MAHDASTSGKGFGRARAAAALAQHAVAGIAPGDHACASFGSDEEQAAIAGRYAHEALRRGARLLILDRDRARDEAAIRAPLERAGIDAEACIALRQVAIRHLGDERDPNAPAALVAALQADRRAALRDGYSALYVATQMSWARAHAGGPAAAARCEHAVDRVFAGAAVAGLCLYDRRLVEPATLCPLVGAHDFQIRTEAQLTTTARRRLTISERDDGTIALAGALDIDSADYLAVRLAQLDADADLVVLTAGLGFADISGCRALVQAAAAGGRERRLVLPDAAAPLVRVLRLCGWSSSERLVLS